MMHDVCDAHWASSLYIIIHVIIIHYICTYIYISFSAFWLYSNIPIYIFSFHHKQYASDQEDFTFVKKTTEVFSSADEFIKGETRLLLRWVGSLATLHTFLLVHITSIVKLVHLSMTKSWVSKSCLKVKAELCFYRFLHFGCVPIHV